MTNIELIKKYFPDHLVKRGRSLLEELGATEIAWRREDALELLEKIKGTNLIVLGGEVHEIKNGRIEPKGEGWYYPITDRVNMPVSSLEESRLKALEYIKKYPEPVGSIIWYVINPAETL